MRSNEIRADERLEEIRTSVETTLRDFVARKQAEIPPEVDIGPAIHPLGDFILCGGKRIRAILGYWGWRGAGGEDADRGRAITAAAGLELCHCFGLIHDDIIDDSDTRRGRPSLHRRLASLHVAEGWSGSAESFGTSSALLMGDLCLFWADELLQDACTEDCLADVLAAWHGMRVSEVCGQMLEMIAQASREFEIPMALTIARYKTARYATERPLQIGAALAGGSEAVRKAYSAFGIPLGEAFQLKDDLLGAFGNPDVTGKPVTDDFREGKPTVLIACAMRNASTSQRARLQKLYGRPDLDENDAADLRGIITDSGAPQVVDDMIESRIRESLGVLEEAPITEPARRALMELSLLIANRDK